MFFDNVLVENTILRPLWRAGNSVVEENEEIKSLPTVWRLDRWVSSESVDASHRLSLRTSAVLIDGAAKIFKKEMERLFEDVSKLDEKIILRNKREPMHLEDDSISSESFDTPEQMMRRAVTQSDISFEAPTRNPVMTPPVVNHSFTAKTPSPLKRKSTLSHTKEFIESPKKIKASSKASTPYPFSPNSSQISDQNSLITDQQSNHSKDSSELQSKNSSNESENSVLLTNQTAKRHIAESSNVIVNTDDKYNNNFEVESSGANSDDAASSNNNEKVPSSPTFTDVFDVVANLPNNNTEISKENHQNHGKTSSTKTDTGKTTESIIDSYRITADIRRIGNRDQSSQASQRSIISKTKKSGQKLRRKKISKSQKTLKDQGTQVSLLLNVDDKDNDMINSLPFGYLLIHDSYRSRFPSKIVISSLKDNINNLGFL